MTFLTSQPDLAGTRYSNDDLVGARRLLVDLLQDHYPSWLNNPVGQLAEYWNDDGRHAATVLIDVADIFRLLYPKTSQRGQRILVGKMKDLFRPCSRKVFEERILELEVGAALVEHVSPLIFEPLAGDVEPGASPPKSPDYGLVLPEGAVLVEVTRLRLAFLENWNAAALDVAKRLERKVLQVEGFRRSFDFSAPISASRHDLERLASRDMIRQILSSPYGSVTLPVSLGEASMTWTSVVDEVPEHPAITSTVAKVTYKPIYASEDDQEERIIGSIRSTLKGKRKKLTVAMPYLLAMRIDEVNNEAVSQRLFSRIFPNDEYAWISGVLLYEVLNSGESTGPRSRLTLHANENARWPLPATIYQIFNENVDFHVPPDFSGDGKSEGVDYRVFRYKFL